MEKFSSWQMIEMNEGIYLYANTNLSIYKTAYQDRSIILLGYILDPDEPEAGDEHIVNNLLEMSSDNDELILNTYRLGGRWILIIDDGKEVRLFHDAAGLRQVFYSDVHRSKDLWCASQPNLIAEALGLHMDKEAVDFINWFKTKSDTLWFPGESSPYKEIKCLMPNHYLSLQNGHPYRYWPNESLHKMSIDEVIEKIPKTFSALMRSAAARFDLALALSAGWDSRLLLASCKGIRQKLTYYTGKSPRMSENHPDLTIPRKLVSKLELKHYIFDFQHVKVRENFEEVFNKSIPFPIDDATIPAQQAHLDYYGRSKVAVTGNVSEIARCFLCNGMCRDSLERGREEQMTGSILSSLAGMEKHPFAVRSFEKWLSEFGEIYNYNILDIMYWEQRMGRWFAMECLHYDIAWKDFMTPYNTRTLIMDLLSVDERYRMQPSYLLYQALMHDLWPEVLSEPINPPMPVRKSWKQCTKCYARRTIESILQRVA